MEQNERDNCCWVAVVGPCDRICVGGFSGLRDPKPECRVYNMSFMST
jgi:hypothetical protein